MQNIIQQNNLNRLVYERLKEMIVDGVFSPGQKLIQEKLAAELGVSRTPLMQALHSLEHEMLVESIPRRGIYVRKISLQEMIDVYDCREAVECMALKLLIERATDAEVLAMKKNFEPFSIGHSIDAKAYQKADEDFHNMIINLSKNPVLQKMSQVSDIHKRVYQFGLIRPPEETLVEHIRIVEAILSRDLEKADQALREHIGLSRRKMIHSQKNDIITN